MTIVFEVEPCQDITPTSAEAAGAKIFRSRLKFVEIDALSTAYQCKGHPLILRQLPVHYNLLRTEHPSLIMQSTTAPAQSMSGVNISKRRKFVADGVFYAELNEFFQRELAEEGYSGVEVRVTPTVTDIIIRATHTQEVLGEQGRRIREVRTPHHLERHDTDGVQLTSLITHRFRFPPDSVSLYAAKVQSRGLSAVAQCESLRYKLLNGLAVRRACYGVLR
jgi:hypothetical protein